MKINTISRSLQHDTFWGLLSHYYMLPESDMVEMLLFFIKDFSLEKIGQELK